MFLDDYDLSHDPYLRDFHAHERIRLIGAFAHAVRTQQFSRSSKGNDCLAPKSCSTAITTVATAFTSAGYSDPRHGPDGKMALLLRRQIKGYTNNHPSPTHQKALSIQVIFDMVQRPLQSPLYKVFHQVSLLAFFFAMRSCEYLRVKGPRRTKPLRKRNIMFIKNHRVLPHHLPEAVLASADAVAITFEFQKNDERDETVTQGATTSRVLCPVKTSAAIVKRMENDGLTDDAFIFTYKDDDGSLYDLTGPIALKLLRTYVGVINYKSLGINDPAEVGLHSIRASAAMAMYLNRVPVYTIMLLGRWASDAFLRYIRKQVEQFCQGVSQAMIQTGHFHHIPDNRRQDNSKTRNLRHHLAYTTQQASTTTQVATNSFRVWT
jgi:hypothetical protein